MDATPPQEPPPEVPYFSLIMSWKSTKYPISIASNDTIGDLKALIWSVTTVPPERQKVLGLVKGKVPSDDVEMSGLGIIEGGKVKEFMMVGTPEGSEHKDSVGPSPVPDEEDYTTRESRKVAETARQNARNKRKLAEATKALNIDIMSPVREGKRLLVLDLDYAILDTALWKEHNFVATHFARPFLHEMLTILAPYYDICFWSQTHWRWLETKLVELEILGENSQGSYPVVFTLDRTPMFSVYSEREGKPFQHEVKALQIIWNKFPNYSAQNTIHVDDLGRNFLMNQGNGLRVKAYKDAMNKRETDRELVWITKYLLQLTSHEDFSTLDHSKFKEYIGDLPEGVEDPVAAQGLKSKKKRKVDDGGTTDSFSVKVVEGGGSGTEETGEPSV